MHEFFEVTEVRVEEQIADKDIKLLIQVMNGMDLARNLEDVSTLIF